MKTRNIEMVLKHMGESPSKEDVQDMINQVDKDGTGVCRFPEFLNMMAARVGLHQNRKCLFVVFMFRFLFFLLKTNLEKRLLFLIWFVNINYVIYWIKSLQF